MSVMTWEASFDPRGRQALGEAMIMARGAGVLDTTHLIAGVVITKGPIAELIATRPERWQRACGALTTPSAPPSCAIRLSWDACQAISSAERWAAARGERIAPEHLAVVLVDQSNPALLDLLEVGGVDRQALRRVALEAIGASPEHGSIRLTAPEGSRPTVWALPPASLVVDDALDVLSQRLEDLPLHRIRRRSQWVALELAEERVASGLAERLELDGDQRAALVAHHLEALRQRVMAIAPKVVPHTPRVTPPETAARRLPGASRRRAHHVGRGASVAFFDPMRAGEGRDARLHAPDF